MTNPIPTIYDALNVAIEETAETIWVESQSQDIHGATDNPRYLKLVAARDAVSVACPGGYALGCLYGRPGEVCQGNCGDPECAYVAMNCLPYICPCWDGEKHHGIVPHIVTTGADWLDEGIVELQLRKVAKAMGFKITLGFESAILERFPYVYPMVNTWEGYDLHGTHLDWLAAAVLEAIGHD